ncbi:MAG: thiamine diphosphokinase [Silicimonas sp.]|nr:thiamine diphosphokinase [Silicimonas sp.]
MNSTNVCSEHGVTLVGGGDPSAQNVTAALSLAPLLVAADGGANFCADMGKEPVAVIGDFDSLDAKTRRKFSYARFIEISGKADQDSTDFQKCLARIGAPFVLGVGFTDARLDHTLANLAALAQMQGPPTILIGTHDVVFAAPRDVTLDFTVGTRISLFPLEDMEGTSEGLEWPIDGLTLSPLGRLGTSNRVVGPVRLQFDKQGCLVLTSRENLPQVLRCLID